MVENSMWIGVLGPLVITSGDDEPVYVAAPASWEVAPHQRILAADGGLVERAIHARYRRGT